MRISIDFNQIRLFDEGFEDEINFKQLVKNKMLRKQIDVFTHKSDS